MDGKGRLGFMLNFNHLQLPAISGHSLFSLIVSHLSVLLKVEGKNLMDLDSLAPGMSVYDRFS